MNAQDPPSDPRVPGSGPADGFGCSPRYARVARRAGVALWELDPARDRVWSAEPPGEGGSEPPALTTEEWLAGVHSADRGRVRSALRRDLAGRGVAHEVEFLAVGGERSVLRRAEIERDEHGAPVRVTGADVDVSPQRRIEEKLLARTRFGRRIAETIPYNVYVLDLKSRTTVYANRHFRGELATDPLTAPHFDSRVLERVVHPADVEAFSRHAGRLATMADEDILSLDVRFRAVDGEWRWFHCKEVVFLRDPGGEVAQVLGTAIDVTDRKAGERERTRLQEQLTRAARVEIVGTLAGGIAHEMNHVLGITMGQGQLGLSAAEPDSPLRESFAEIVEASRRGRDIVSRILAFGRQGPERREVLEASEGVQEVLRLVRPLLPSGVQVETRLVDSLPIEMDPTQLHQVIVNLCTNAGHAMSKTGGELRVEVDPVDFSADEVPPADLEARVYVRIRVRDTGQGIRAEDQKRIFDPFFSTKPIGEGTGLGLSVVEGIVHEQGGAIRVDSQWGVGTTVDVYLPISRTDAESPAAAPPTIGRGRIMFVDDEPSVVRVTSSMLETIGYHVAGFTSSAEALHAYLQDPGALDLLMTDENMPDLPGHELAREVRRVRPDLPVIICTGYSDAVSTREMRSAGVRAVVRKPLLLEELGEIVQNALSDQPA